MMLLANFITNPALQGRVLASLERKILSILKCIEPSSFTNTVSN